MFNDYGYNRIVGFEPQWIRKGIKCPTPEHISKNLKEICSFFSESGQDTVGLVVPKIKKSKENKIDYSKMYFTLESIDNNNGFSVYIYPEDVSSEEYSFISYSLDNGNTWTKLTNQGESQLEVSTGPLSAGQKILFKGVGTTTNGAVWFEQDNYDSGFFNVYGNIMSLLYGDDFKDRTSFAEGTIRNLSSLFFINIISAKNLILPATTLTSQCYSYSFASNHSLQEAPELPATQLAANCYEGMFSECTSLINAPELPATTLVEYCYSVMFSNCTSLSYVKCLATGITAHLCTANWLNNVSETGTFIKAAGVEWPTNSHGIPNGWTVEEI